MTSKVLIILLMACIFGVDGIIRTTKLNDLANLKTFIDVARMRRHVQAVTNIAPRPVGSLRNEETIIRFLVKELEDIKRIAVDNSHYFNVEVQKARGCFTLNKMQGVSSFTSVYDNIQNIVVTIGPVWENGVSNHSLLINAHFDTDPSSKEASDSSTNCVTMLEVLRALSHRTLKLESYVIFLFNGASKTGMQGAHAFITQNKAAKDVKAFLDLQSMGAGGQQLLYQAGPDHAWQVTAYASAANHPFGSILAQEIFYSGLVPSETDYRVMRDFGHIPGIGLIFIKNGYVYGTMYDLPDLISDEDLKDSAETILNIVQYILRSPYLKHPLDLRNGKVVYFDMFGLFVVAYSQDRAFVINESIAILVLLELLYKIKKAKHDEPKSTQVWKRMATATALLLLCWAFNLGVTSALGAILGASGYGMSWYRFPYWMIGLYICPSIGVLIGTTCLIAWQWIKRTRMDPWEVEGLFFDATRFIWSIMLWALTRATVKSAFIATSWLLFPTLLRSLPAHLCITKNVRYFSVKMICVYSLSLVIPMSMSLYMSWLVYILIIPVLGRSGASVNSDLIIAFICAIFVTGCLAYLTTFIYVAYQHAWKCIPAFFIAHLITIIVLVSSDRGFPYSDDNDSPHPQKYIIQHVGRTIYHDKHNIEKDSGYWIIPLDYNGPANLYKHVPKLKDAKEINDDCDNKVFCGLPMYLPDLYIYSDTYFLDTTGNDEPRLDSNTVTKPKILECQKEAINIYLTKISFRIAGPDHMSIQLHMKPDMLLVRWSMDAFIPDPPQSIEGLPAYFIFYARGSHRPRDTDHHPWEFWIEINHAENTSPELFDMAIIGHYMHGTSMRTSKFSSFLSSFPNWTHVTSWSSTYDKYSHLMLC